MFDGRCDGPSNIICQKQNSATATTQDSTTLDFDDVEESSEWILYVSAINLSF